MNELMIFESPRFGEIRTITEGDRTLFCAKDVAAALGYKDTTNAIKQHCRGVVKRHLPHRNPMVISSPLYPIGPRGNPS